MNGDSSPSVPLRVIIGLCATTDGQLKSFVIGFRYHCVRMGSRAMSKRGNDFFIGSGITLSVCKIANN